MPKRTYENSANQISNATDLEMLAQINVNTETTHQKPTKGKEDIKRLTKQLVRINREVNGDYLDQYTPTEEFIHVLTKSFTKQLEQKSYISSR